jgi:hypothetical protein
MLKSIPKAKIDQLLAPQVKTIKLTWRALELQRSTIHTELRSENGLKN